MEQILYHTASAGETVELLKTELPYQDYFLVCGHTSSKTALGRMLADSGLCGYMFSDFGSNPDILAAVAGAKAFREGAYDAILAVGGGSAIDVAKCIKLFANTPYEEGMNPGAYQDSDIPLTVIPTTAGTGSEATHFAVVYENGIKKSVASGSAMPDHVIFCPELIEGLPEYHRKATALDALCHAVESMWSVRSDEESKEYARTSLKLILRHAKGYVNGRSDDTAGMQKAAYYAGRAINISKTTAAHAMSYGLTGHFGIAHGHAAALCLRVLWPYMLEHVDDCIDPRGSKYLAGVFRELDEIYAFFNELNLDKPPMPDETVLRELTGKVNVERLSNNPVSLDEDTILKLYEKIFETA